MEYYNTDIKNATFTYVIANTTDEIPTTEMGIKTGLIVKQTSSTGFDLYATDEDGVVLKLNTGETTDTPILDQLSIVRKEMFNMVNGIPDSEVVTISNSSGTTVTIMDGDKAVIIPTSTRIKYCPINSDRVLVPAVTPGRTLIISNRYLVGEGLPPVPLSITKAINRGLNIINYTGNPIVKTSRVRILKNTKDVNFFLSHNGIIIEEDVVYRTTTDPTYDIIPSSTMIVSVNGGALEWKTNRSSITVPDEDSEIKIWQLSNQTYYVNRTVAGVDSSPTVKGVIYLEDSVLYPPNDRTGYVINGIVALAVENTPTINITKIVITGGENTEEITEGWTIISKDDSKILLLPSPDKFRPGYNNTITVHGTT